MDQIDFKLHWQISSFLEQNLDDLNMKLESSLDEKLEEMMSSDPFQNHESNLNNDFIERFEVEVELDRNQVGKTDDFANDFGEYREEEEEEKEEEEEERPFQCDACNLSYLSRKALLAHQKKHTGYLRFSCKKCPKLFYEYADLRVHLKSHDQTPFKCPKCPEGYFTIKELKEHMQGHDDLNKFQCKICGVDSMLLSEFILHMEEHESSNLYCSICNRWFRRPLRLISHMFQKHNISIDVKSDK